MITLSIEAKNLQIKLQHYAAQGLLTCKERQQRLLRFDVISTVALNAISVTATVAAIAWSLPIVVPVLLGIGSVGLLAYNVHTLYYRLLDKKEADRWQPIFNDITRVSFSEAHTKIENILKNVSVPQLWNVEKKFIVEDPSESRYIRICYLHSSTAILHALAELSSGVKKTDAQLQDICANIKKWGERQAGGGGREFTDKWCQLITETHKLDDATNVFKPSAVKPNGAFLLIGVIDQLYKRSEDDPKSIRNYLKLIQLHEKENLGPTEKTVLEALIKCKNYAEMKKEAQNISKETFESLGQLVTQ